MQYDLLIHTQERQVPLSAGACVCLKPAAAERSQVQGSQGGKEYEEEWGALDIWRRDTAKLRGEGRKRAREVAARARGANEGRSSTEQ